MKIYKDYTTDDLICNEPCYVDIMGGYIYPISVNDYRKVFDKYVIYIIHNKKTLGLPKEIDLLNGLIATMSKTFCETKKMKEEEAFVYVINQLSELFSLVTKQTMIPKFDKNKNGVVSIYFQNENENLKIDSNVFVVIRKIILKMNLLHEARYYEREVDRVWEEKAMIAKSKNSPKLELGEIMLIVSQDMKWDLDYINNKLNIFQLYAYYNRICKVDDSDKTSMFACVSSSIKPVPFVKGVYEDLYRDPYADLNVKDTSGFFKGLK